jgi:hypothetical protein
VCLFLRRIPRKRIVEVLKVQGMVGDKRVDAAGNNNQRIRRVFITRIKATGGKVVYRV